MGYPVFIGFDPWFLGTAPSWGMVGRMKRRENEEIESPETEETIASLRLKRDITGDKRDKPSNNVAPIPSVPPIPSTPSIPSISSEDGTDKGDNIESNSTDLNGFDDLEQGTWPAIFGPGNPSMAFGLSPIDFWTAMMLENAMMNSGGWVADDGWLSNQTETMQDGNETEVGGGQWWLPEFWSSSGFNESPLPESEEGLKENSEQSQDKARMRVKRFAGPNMYQGFYFPNFFNPSYAMKMRMMANMMRYRRFNPNFSRMMYRYPWNYRYYYRNWQRRPYMNRWFGRYPYGGMIMAPSSYWMKRGTGNRMFRGFSQAPTVGSGSRSKREADEVVRNKRWQGYGWHPYETGWNYWSRFGNSGQNYYWPNQWMSNGFGGNFWKRDADEEQDNKRSKREAEKNNREKRWEKMLWLPMRYISAHWKRFTDWEGWDLFNPLNRWPLGNVMNSADYGNFWKRDVQEDDKEEKIKRDADDENREKRWGSNPMYPNWYDRNSLQNYFQYNGFSPMDKSMSQWPHNQWSNFWKRDSQGQDSITRSKRASEKSDRDKRWHSGNWHPQSYGWSRWPQNYHSNDFQYRGWGMNQWSRRWPGMGNWNEFWKRDAGEDKKGSRSKRETNSDDRKKRWYSEMWNLEQYGRNRWPYYSSWNNNKWGMFDGRNQVFDRYRYNRWWDGSWKRDVADEDTNNRHKRESEDDVTSRSKRNYMSWNHMSPYWNRGWSQWQNSYMNQMWNPYSSMFNNMMYKRDSEDESDKRNKRSPDFTKKQKRQGMTWGSPYWNSWTPQSYNLYGDWQANQWQYPYYSMWKRNTQDHHETARIKRTPANINRQRRFGMLWNFRSPYWNRWSWRAYSPYYNWYMFRRFYNGMPIWFNYGNRMWKRSTDKTSGTTRSKREIKEAKREKRYRMWNPQWSYQWSLPYNNWWNSYNSMSSWPNYGMYSFWKRDAEVNSEKSRTKRSSDSMDRQKRYGMMWNSRSNFWNNQPWQWQMEQWWDPFNFRTQMWKRNTEDEFKKSRVRRDTGETNRSKRYGWIGNAGWPWQWQRMSPYAGMPNWSNYYGNQMWKRDAEENPGDSRTKRDTGTTERNKRDGVMWNFIPPYSPYFTWWYQRWRYFNGIPSWLNNRNHMWKRDTHEDAEASQIKRDTADENKMKRSGTFFNSPDPYMNTWQSYSPYSNRYINQRWNSYNHIPNWHNFEGPFWKRETKTESDEPRNKRDSEAVNREKRNWMTWNYRSPYWNRGYQNFPSSQQYPSWHFYGKRPNWSGYSNYMWKRESPEDLVESRPKRDANEIKREKRYGTYWNRWSSPYNNWYMHQGWNEQNYMPYWFNYGRQMWKRNFDELKDSRTKRDVDSTENRVKRQNMMRNFGWPSQDRWSWNGYSPSSSWQGNRWWNQVNGMPYWSNYGNQMWKRGTENKSSESRRKRDTKDSSREKRWGMMTSPYWNRWQSQNMYHSWNRYNYMPNWYSYGHPMGKRNIDMTAESTKTKREVDPVMREKRQGNMWNFGWPWQWQTPPAPSYMQPKWNFHYRRGNFEVSGSHMSKRGTQDDTMEIRNKRDTSDAERKKRFGMTWHSRSPWQWDYPHSNWHMRQSWQPYGSLTNWYSYGNQMWKREIEEKHEEPRSKRDTAAINRKRRYGMMWNPTYNYWNMPWQLYNTWYPSYMPNWFGYGNKMLKRDSELDSTETRTKRDIEDVDREKRQGMMGSYWNGRPWQWYNPSGDWQMNRWNHFNGGSGWFRDSINMWKRGTKDASDDSRIKRETGDITREKRYGNMWNSRSHNWNGWNWRYPSNNGYMNTYSGMPYWHNYGRWRNNMWKRGAEGEYETSRSKRDAGDKSREKRFTMMWNPRSHYWNTSPWQWHSTSSDWYMPNWFSGNQFWKRGAQEASEKNRAKRDTADGNKVKRQGMMNQFRYPFWNERYSGLYYPSNNWNVHQNWNSYNNFPSSWNYGMSKAWKRDAQETSENSRSKRNADDIERTKRRGGMMWNSRPWHWQSPFAKWGMPIFFDYGNWGHQMWKREGQEGLENSRAKRDTTAVDKEKWLANMKDSTKAETSKRQFSFNKKTSPTSKPMNSEESVWRSAKKKYGEERTWQRRLNQGNSKWQHGLNKNYGYPRNKWGNGGMPSSYRTNTGNWMQNPGRGYSWKNNQGMYPSRNYGMASIGMPSINNGGRYGGMLRGNSYDQPYANQWVGAFNGNEGMKSFWPMEWSGGFSPYGMYGANPMSMRYFREAQSKRQTQDPEYSTAKDDENASNLRQKRDAMNGENPLDREKRFSHFFNGNFFNPMNNFYRYNKMRQMWAPWFFYSFCQPQPRWGSRMFNLYKRNATKSDDDSAFFKPKEETPTTQWLDSEKEKRQGRFYNSAGYERPLSSRAGYWNRNRNQYWQYYNLMCPQAWNIMQRNFRAPGNFFPYVNAHNFFQGMGNPYFHYLRQQSRWKRSDQGESMAANTRSSNNAGYDDARGRRQWGNFWQGWPRGYGPEDCEEWAAPMPAWSPWRGWNMLRKDRDTDASEDRNKRETGSDEEKSLFGEDLDVMGKRAVPRCRTWRGRNFNKPNMDMAMTMGNRIPVDRFGMDSWRNKWMGGSRWDSRRYRRDWEDVDSDDREK